jgi:hypothetical protein
MPKVSIIGWNTKTIQNMKHDPNLLFSARIAHPHQMGRGSQRPSSQADFPAAYVSKTRVRNTALCDYVTRVLSDRLRGGGGTDWTLGRVHLVGWENWESCKSCCCGLNTCPLVLGWHRLELLASWRTHNTNRMMCPPIQGTIGTS